ncbi:hypothetical protein COW36_23660 [bacterium (Candidatus Blackallbacteria) CG17_big_fil_post_rev_8_21_14_2_50_48_46]|uniref:Outer membrane beta-barrel domain-containing protein n=1 Tax=bacterium (Candidatus Blackallbacteria) CG17_big_fil_post_rev_8_21_14_2_50_48_46 TaxID=2014261 RepID=A0A2M7FXN3_9BACT|nr:MAG: hypothetical protein COW64_17870 [bacterium (Candidatus Blackallbacteria) CG18_big_fil_WC_8_21_14_2_50_49_26]PIW14034.1 MAG: hypothetical protein COW36_23660 [bacterium (Candidatus Blackallbacteria) CG17_big_fil_post_rev_8_21_14_2_50_48_46]PIW50746.1 MAG: hypothetical protein COW20_01565 [bacterium (Candidatus Blackallbacteria) CG13_big_fil_rev_8_21_14_2_50_49_14]
MKLTSKFVAIAVLASSLCLALSTGVRAQEDDSPVFPVKTPGAPTPKTTEFQFSLLDQGINDISRSMMLRLAYRQLLASETDRQQGYVLDAHFHHFFNTSPATLERFLSASQVAGYPNYNEISAGVGYRFAWENFALIPQAHFRDMFAMAPNVQQHLIGFEPGVRLEYWLYPEVARISVDYGFNVPVLHLANQVSNVSPFTLTLHRIYTEMNYRLLPNLDLLAGFYWWQAPAQLGSGSITDRTLSNIFGFQVGAGFVL